MHQSNNKNNFNQNSSQIDLDASSTNLNSNIARSRTPTRKGTPNSFFIPPPNNPFLTINMNPYLGGRMYKPPNRCLNPCTRFSSASRRTPLSNFYIRVIPWDNDINDYVYATINPAIFRGRFNNFLMKSVIDKYLTSKPKDFTGSYPCVLVTGLVLIFLGLLAFFLCIFVFFNTQFKQKFDLKQFWGWFFIFLPILFVLIILNAICCARAASDRRTKERHIAIDLACRELNEIHFNGSHLRVQPGDWSAWLELRVIDALHGILLC